MINQKIIKLYILTKVIYFSRYNLILTQFNHLFSSLLSYADVSFIFCKVKTLSSYVILTKVILDIIKLTQLHKPLSDSHENFFFFHKCIFFQHYRHVRHVDYISYSIKQDKSIMHASCFIYLNIPPSCYCNLD